MSGFQKSLINNFVENTRYGWTQVASITNVVGLADEAAQVTAGRLVLV